MYIISPGVGRQLLERDLHVDHIVLRLLGELQLPPETNLVPVPEPVLDYRLPPSVSGHTDGYSSYYKLHCLPPTIIEVLLVTTYSCSFNFTSPNALIVFTCFYLASHVCMYVCMFVPDFFQLDSAPF